MSNYSNKSKYSNNNYYIYIYNLFINGCFGILCLSAIRMMVVKILLTVCMLVGVVV